MDTIGHNSQAQIKGFVERIINVENDIELAKKDHISPLRKDIRDLYSEAASQGFDKKALKEVIRKSKMSEDLRYNIDQYENAALHEVME